MLWRLRSVRFLLAARMCAVRRLRRGGFVTRAARLVSASEVLNWVGIPAPGTPPPGVSVKVTCPFSETHPPDRQGEKDMRIYNDGRAYCHICTEQYDSVALAAQLWSLTRFEAAKAILARSGLDMSGSEEDLQSLLVQIKPERLRGDAVHALGVWADVNGIDRFGDSYFRCLGLADQIKSEDHIQGWLTACKDYLIQERSRA